MNFCLYGSWDRSWVGCAEDEPLVIGLWFECCPLGGASALELMVWTGAVDPVWFGVIVGVSSPGRAVESLPMKETLTYLGCSPPEAHSAARFWFLCVSCC